MAQTGAGDLIVTNAKIATLDADHRIAEAVAVGDERILAVGGNDEIEPYAGEGTRRIDAGGKLVVPGLIDGHAHLDREGLKDTLPTLAGCRSIRDIQERIAVPGRAGAGRRMDRHNADRRTSIL